PTRHAEMVAISNAIGALSTSDWELADCTLEVTVEPCSMCAGAMVLARLPRVVFGDRKSTRLNSSHVSISYAVFCLKKKTSSLQSVDNKRRHSGGIALVRVNHQFHRGHSRDNKDKHHSDKRDIQTPDARRRTPPSAT